MSKKNSQKNNLKIPKGIGILEWIKKSNSGVCRKNKFLTEKEFNEFLRESFHKNN